MLEIKNLTFSYGDKSIFLDASISGISNSDKIGIVGKNGTGKTTLLKIISGDIKPDFGEINFLTKDLSLGFMKQEFSYEDLELNKTVFEYISDTTGYKKIEEKINKIYDKLSINFDYDLIKNLEILQEKFERLGSYNFYDRVNNMLLKLISNGVNLNSNLNTLSGGQKSKILLLESLIKGGDILLLDEPTNNLDFDSVNWLIDYINSLNSLVFIVSHDKYFLNKVTNKTIELNDGKLLKYSGNFDFYLMGKNKQKQKNESEYQEYKEKNKDLKQKLGQELNKKGKTEKIDRNLNLPRIIMGKYKDEAQKSNGGKINRIKRELELLEKGKPEFNKLKELNFSLEIDDKVHTGIYVSNLEFKYPNSNNGINVENFRVEKGEKVLIFGENGSGKTTFIKLLTNELSGYNGNIDISKSIKIGNYFQEKKFLDKNNDTLINFMSKNLKEKDLSFINNILKKFNFKENELNKKVKLLSPGQKNRLLLSLFALSKYDTIIFDEPTNHLDLEAIEELKNSLKNFNGNLILISHDRGFIENIVFDRYYKIYGGFLKEVYSYE